MTTKGRPGGPPGQRDRKRPAPTIDLTATEVASEPVVSESVPPPQAAEPPASDAPVAAQASPAPAEAPPPVPEMPRQMQAEIPRADPPPRRPDEPPGETPPPPPQSRRPAVAWLPPDFPWPFAAAGGVGAVLMLVVLAVAGVFSGRESAPTATAETRVAQLEQQVRELAARSISPAADPKSVDDLAARTARLETIVATPKPPVMDTALANRIATLEGEIRALAERAGVLARRNDEIASLAGEARKRADDFAAALAELRKAPPATVVPRAELEALANRIGALERIAKAIESQLGRAGGETPSDRSVRILVVANMLGAAVEHGAPFVAELTAAKASAADPKLLAPLEPFAKSGMPPVDALARELAALIPALAKATGAAARDGSLLDRLKANAERIVRIRPIDEVPGDDPAAILQRIEARASQANLTGAMDELAKLPAPARALAKEWVAKVEARNTAVAASRRFAADALAAVGKPSL